MIKFIHTADIHLDSPLRGLESHDDAPVEEIRGATRRAFVSLVDFAITEQIAFILICGDLYDGSWKDYQTGIFFARQMGRLQEAGIKVFIVSGNHDAASQISKTLPLPDNVTVFSSKKPQSIALDDLGVLIHGQGYGSRSVSDNLAISYPQADSNYLNIGMLHTSLNGREGHENYAPCSEVDLTSKGYDYWALGHVHQREIVATDPWIVFPGNLQGRHSREVGSKGAALVTVTDSQIYEVEHLDFDVLRWAVYQVDLGGCEASGQVHEKVRLVMEKAKAMAEDRPLALRLELTGSCPLHTNFHIKTAEWMADFRSLAASFSGIWLEKVKLKTTPVRDLSHVADDSPVASLLATIEELDYENMSPVSLVPDIADLYSKLPPDLHEAALWGDGNKTTELLTGVREFLVSRLMDQGGE